MSTEHPRATQPPRPSRAPTSSAEVPPNSDLPPPPPPLTASGAHPPETKPGQTHPYTAASSTGSFSFDIASIVANKAAAFGQSVTSDPQSRPNIRAKAVTGRTIFVKDRMTPTTAPTPQLALNQLGRMVSQQKVKTKFFQQRFHERPGLKRKRLASERWRKRFKTGFKATVSRVLELKKQGW